MSELTRLNVGGVPFITTKETLCTNSPFFSRMLDGSMKAGTNLDGAIFIDRNGILFSHVLDYLRNGDNWIPSPDIKLLHDLRNEAAYFSLDGMIEILDDLMPRSICIVASTNCDLGILYAPDEIREQLETVDRTNLNDYVHDHYPEYVRKKTDDPTDRYYECPFETRLQLRRARRAGKELPSYDQRVKQKETRVLNDETNWRKLHPNGFPLT